MDKQIGRIAVAVFAAIALIGCKNGETEQAPPQIQAIPVSVFTAKVTDVPIALEYPAKLHSSGFVEVRAKVGGTLLKREYVEGTQVKEGSTLFVIDPAKYEATKDAAQAAFNQAEREYKRTQKLFSNAAVSERERDAALAAYESTKAALANAVIDLDYAKVKAPISGFVGQKALDVGNLISAGTLLTTITQTDPLYAEFAFSGMERLREGYALEKGTWTDPSINVALKSESGALYTENGKIDFIDAAIDNQSGSVKARAVIPNPRGTLLPGQFARVRLTGIIKKNAVSIPQEVLMQGPQGSFVYVVKDGKAAAQSVTLEQSAGDNFILSDGLKDGDLIIANNLTKIRPGAPVAPISQTNQ
ncbi:MAG: efflux RND transporter periplasmic adaptor subunit [Helicobacteraceae bacterium]|jgi:membrane fusion protein (multidrug efflux system)|nr:efflux RND transporter periplasmic adaptor subunit [Helicobacteraceae bacterium]